MESVVLSDGAKQAIKSLAKISIALGVLGIIIYMTPVFDIMYHFMFFALIPLAILAATGIISVESLQLFKLGSKDLAKRINIARQQIYEEMETQSA